MAAAASTTAGCSGGGGIGGSSGPLRYSKLLSQTDAVIGEFEVDGDEEMVPPPPPPLPPAVYPGAVDVTVWDLPASFPRSLVSASAPDVEFGRDTWVSLVQNGDGRPESIRDLVALKVVFSSQLPKMPKEYILRLMLDRKHQAVCLKRVGEGGRGEEVVGGMCFRPFPTQGFAEIVFLAVSAKYQVRGYGTRLMNEVKDYCRRCGLRYFLTFADNNAIGYFRKQGFSKQVQMSEARWKGYIKEYEGGTLMECRLLPDADYLDVRGMVRSQMAAVQERLRALARSETVYPGYTAFREGIGHLPIEQIRGVVEAGWRPANRRTSNRLQSGGSGLPPSALTDLQANLWSVVKDMRKVPDAWPFLEPVSAVEVPTYYDVIRHPMDLQTMARNVELGKYKTLDQFRRDGQLIWDNCRTFNQPQSEYYRCANVCNAKFEALVRKYCTGPSSSSPRRVVYTVDDSD